MILFEKIALISAIIAFMGYLFQILMIVGCCDKHIKLQVNMFAMTLMTMLIALISYFISLVIK